ncbi:DEAD/DEAH box helicase family protein [Candidatus Woesearchaeota archaeon]|nr:MAG: fanconi anemia group M protein [archaeon GW2011_AR18]MBS3161166.1 DEAD/DEAH box helicase family protein [Candidatus Woesearchaeota archaeon]HIH25966.1 DEAD/DEAH box helicase family protein [Nanoarchaeota archaeon]
MQIRNFTPRTYQLNILNTCKANNTLVCIPTGLGKTKIAIMLAAEVLDKRPEAKVIVLTPTRPLADQITKEFQECLDIDKEKIILLTGETHASKRDVKYEDSQIIIATPQTVQKDIENNRIDLDKIGLLVIDEAHRSRQKFANTIVSKNLSEKGTSRILALTASPGNTKAKIDEICENLGITAVEIRSESDEDVKEHVQKKDAEYVEIEFPEQLKRIHTMIKDYYKERLENVKSFGIYKPLSVVNKTDLILLQRRLQGEIQRNNQSAFYGMSLVAQLLKLSYMLETLETQGVKSLNYFLKKLETETSKASKTILANPKIIEARKELDKLKEQDIEHPKFNKLLEIIKNNLETNKNFRIIIFATYRNTVDNIYNLLNNSGIRAIKLVGQNLGLTQKEQIESIKQFNDGVYNCLITTSIGEEGLSIKEADIAIFYDNTPSSIRKIQRAGRVGRMKEGKVIFLVTKGTIDAAYYWKSKKDETKMKNILYKMKDKGISVKQNSLNDFK